MDIETRKGAPHTCHRCYLGTYYVDINGMVYTGYWIQHNES